MPAVVTHVSAALDVGLVRGAARTPAGRHGGGVRSFRQRVVSGPNCEGPFGARAPLDAGFLTLARVALYWPRLGSMTCLPLCEETDR